MGGRTHGPLRGLLGALFLAGLNDNVLRVVVIFLLLEGEGPETAKHLATSAAFLAFCLPYVLFSVPAGWLADRVSKRKLIVGVKVLEVGLMGLCALALLHGAWWALLGVLALLGTLGALLSLAKYAILPELLPPERLSRGNGQLILWTFLAVVGGSTAGGFLLDALRKDPWAIGALLGLLALWGVGFALSIPRVPAAGRRRGGPMASMRAGLADLRHDVPLKTGLLGSLWFWSLAALVQQDAVVYAEVSLALSDAGKSVLLGALFVGVGLGSAAAGVLARGHLGLRLVPLGAVCAAAAACAFGWLRPDFPGAAGLLLLLGFAAGFFVVPINALIQQRSPATDRGAVMAIVNVVVFTGILAGSGLAMGLAFLGLGASRIMFAVGIVAAAGGIWFAVRGISAARGS